MIKNTEQWCFETMDQDAFATTQFALTLLKGETWIPDFSMTVKDYSSIYITIDLKKKYKNKPKPNIITDSSVQTRQSWQKFRYRRGQDSFEQCLKVTVGILRAGEGGVLK